MGSDLNQRTNQLRLIKANFQDYLNENAFKEYLDVYSLDLEDKDACQKSSTVCVFECFCSANCPEGCSTGCSSGYCHTGNK